MLDLTVFCQECGRRVHRRVDENCPPSCIRCVCGARFPLKLEEPTARYNFSSGAGDGDEGDWCSDGILKEHKLL